MSSAMSEEQPRRLRSTAKWRSTSVRSASRRASPRSYPARSNSARRQSTTRSTSGPRVSVASAAVMSLFTSYEMGLWFLPTMGDSTHLILCTMSRRSGDGARKLERNALPEVAFNSQCQVVSLPQESVPRKTNRLLLDLAIGIEVVDDVVRTRHPEAGCSLHADRLDSRSGPYLLTDELTVEVAAELGEQNPRASFRSPEEEHLPSRSRPVEENRVRTAETGELWLGDLE